MQKTHVESEHRGWVLGVNVVGGTKRKQNLMEGPLYGNEREGIELWLCGDVGQ